MRQAEDNSPLLKREIFHLERNLPPPPSAHEAAGPIGTGRGVQVGCCTVSLDRQGRQHPALGRAPAVLS